MNLGDKIKIIRYKHNITQDELAKILEINRNYLSRIETNKSLPNAETLIKLAKYFNISIDNLLDINLDCYDVGNKKEKIKKINQYCLDLSNDDLDFLLRLLNTLSKKGK